MTLVEKIINLLMIDGKKSKAFTIFHEAIHFFHYLNVQNEWQQQKLISKTINKNYKVNLIAKETLLSNKLTQKNLNESLDVTLLTQAIENVKPYVEVRKVRVSRMIYQVPSIVKKKRQENLAIRWLVDSAKKRKKKSNLTYAKCLGLEFFDAFRRIGLVKQKRDDLHKLAESNRAFIKYRWW